MYYIITWYFRNLKHEDFFFIFLLKEDNRSNKFIFRGRRQLSDFIMSKTLFTSKKWEHQIVKEALEKKKRKY